MMPSTIILGGRTYELMSLLRSGETRISVDVMRRRTAQMNAASCGNHARWLLKHQRDIPPNLRNKVAFLFSDWESYAGRGRVGIVYWQPDCRVWEELFVLSTATPWIQGVFVIRHVSG